MAAPLMSKIMLTYLTISIILSLMGGANADGVSNNLVDRVVNTSNGVLDSGLQDALPNVNEETGSDSGILAFIDSLKAVRNFLIWASTVSLAIPMVLLDIQMPLMIQLLFGIPTTVLLIFGIVYFARSGA